MSEQAHQIRVAVLGSGGREHALAYQISKSSQCASVAVLPGNDGIGQSLKCEPIDFSDFDVVAKKLKELKTDLVVVGPDQLLADGIVDRLEAKGFKVFGPSQAAAKVEWSKSFAKSVCQQTDIPIAKSFLIQNPEDLSKASQAVGGYPLVLKFDGLALGKGVQICADEFEAKEFLVQVFDQNKFGNQPDKLVVAEEFLEGHELSLFAISDGNTFAVLDAACDYKTLKEGNRGLNTGGMGAYSPVPWMSRDKLKKIENAIFPRLFEHMRSIGTPFKGLLYAGLMVSGADFRVLEFNARFGDPETQTLMPRLKSDLLPLLYGSATGNLEKALLQHPLRWSEQTSVNIVVASPGYPEAPKTGIPIKFNDSESVLIKDGMVYFAGIKSKDRQWVNSGGRVLSVSALGPDLESANHSAISAIEKIEFEGMHYRRDIGLVRLD